MLEEAVISETEYLEHNCDSDFLKLGTCYYLSLLSYLGYMNICI